jgi:site-specific recombinase XerD
LLENVKANSVRDHALFTVMYWRGLRAGEVAKIQLSDWRQDTGQLFVNRLKGSNSGQYFVSPDEIKALGTWVRIRGSQPGPLFPSRHGAGIGRRMLDSLIKRYVPKDWPEDIKHCHTLRHSIAVHLLEKGAELLAVQNWLGHRSILSTMKYVDFTSPMRKRTEKLAYGDPDQEAKVEVDWKADKRKWAKKRGRR